jgi:Regulator of ribonuclease activity B
MGRPRAGVGDDLVVGLLDRIRNIDQAEWEPTVNPPDGAIVEWSLRAEGYRVVGAATVEAFRAWFEQIAHDHRGEYDGWEAAAKP